jgi:hypothetical protein
LSSCLLFFLLSPARGRGWVRGLHTIVDHPLTQPLPQGGEELEED